MRIVTGVIARHHDSLSRQPTWDRVRHRKQISSLPCPLTDRSIFPTQARAFARLDSFLWCNGHEIALSYRLETAFHVFFSVAAKVLVVAPMSCKRPTAVLIVICALGELLGVPVFASDLTISRTSNTVASPTGLSMARQKPNAAAMNDRPAGKKDARAKDAERQRTNKEMSKRADKERQRKIVIYNLFHDHVFKLGGAATDKRHFGAINAGIPLGAGFGHALTASAAPTLPTSVPVGPTLKVDSDDNVGIAFDCLEKPLGSSPIRRSFTACYKQKLDKSWRTQTYVSGGRLDGNLSWGGGLAFGYDY